MKTKTLFTIVTIIILTSSVLGFAQQEKPELSNTMQASCVVRIVVDENILPPDGQSIFFLLSSSNIGGKAAKQVLDVTPEGIDEWKNVLQIKQISKSYFSPRNYIYTILVSVNTEFSGVPAAEKFLYAIVDAFRKSLENSFDDYMQLMEAQKEIAEDNAHKAEAELRTMQEELRKISGSRNLSREAVLKDISSITEDMRNKKSTLDIMDVRRDNLAQQIAEIRQKVKDKMQDNPILSDMHKMVDIESKKLEKISHLVELGQLSEQELFEAQASLTKAKIELAQKEQEIKDAAGGLQADKLAGEFDNINFVERENAVKIQNLHEQLAEMNELMKSVDEYEIVSLKVNTAKVSLEKVLAGADEIKRSFNSIAPSVKIVGPE